MPCIRSWLTIDCVYESQCTRNPVIKPCKLHLKETKPELWIRNRAWTNLEGCAVNVNCAYIGEVTSEVCIPFGLGSCYNDLSEFLSEPRQVTELQRKPVRCLLISGEIVDYVEICPCWVSALTLFCQPVNAGWLIGSVSFCWPDVVP